jgi:hypothetical protein
LLCADDLAIRLVLYGDIELKRIYKK